MSVVLFLKVQPSSAFRLPVKTNVLTHQISSIRSDQWSMIILIWLLTRSNVRFWGVSVYLIRNQLQNGCDIVIKNVIFNQILSMQFAWRNRCIILHIIVIFVPIYILDICLFLRNVISLKWLSGIQYRL